MVKFIDAILDTTSSVSSTVYITGVTTPWKLVSGIKLTSPVLVLIVHSPSPGTVMLVPNEFPLASTNTTLVGSILPSASVSLSNTAIVTGISSGEDKLLSAATGASFTGLKLAVTTPGNDSCPLLSSIVYSIGVTAPLKSVSGVKVSTPVVSSTVHTPSSGTVNVCPSGDKLEPAGGLTNVTLLGSKLPSISLSLSTTEISKGMSSVPVPLSFDVTGASFTAVTITLTVAGFEVPPDTSSTVYCIGVTVPL